MRLGTVIGRVTLSQAVGSLKGARWLLVSPFNKEHFQNGRQAIKFINKNELPSGAVEFIYELESRGVLWDDDIVSLQTFCSHQFRTPLLEACTEMQLNQVGLLVDNENIENSYK